MAKSEILAFSANQVRRLTGLTMRQLAYWDRTGFFAPSYGEGGPRSPYSRVYSFRDVVGLRALAQMRNVHGVPLQHLRRVGQYLATRYREPWSELTFFIVGRSVYYREQEAIRRADIAGQTILPFAMRKVEQEVRREAQRLQERSVQDVGRIAKQRYVAENKAVIAGTRVPVDAIKDFHLAGYSDEEIIREFPLLTPADISAALRYREKKIKSA